MAKFSDNKKVILIYFVAVLVYICIALFMKPAVHLKVDEDLYLSMAKAFHQGKGFMSHGEITDYSCVLYSMVISLAYFFYKPSSILFTIRVINVFVMCSAAFPVYFISRKLLKDKYVIYAVIFSLLIPDMIDTMYIMQENLYYPVAMWTFYFLIKDLDEGSNINKYSIAGIVGLCLTYMSKTVGLAFFVAYIVSLIIIWKKSCIKKVLFSGIVYLVLLKLNDLFIYAANGFVNGNNHYARQITWLFPLSMTTVIAAIIGVIVYVIFFLLSTGILPVVWPLLSTDDAGENDKRYLVYAYTSIVMLIGEIVVTIFLTEEHGEIVPHKFLFRYMFPIGVLLVICMLSLWQKNRGCSSRSVVQKIVLPVYLITFAGAIVYYICINLKARTSIIDSHVNLLLETANKMTFSYMAVVMLLALGIVSVIGVFFVIFKKDIKNLPVFWFRVASIFAVLFLLINAIQHPYYSRVIVDGSKREPDFVKVAEKLGKEDVDIYVLSENYDNNSLIFGYIYQDYKHITDFAEIKGTGNKIIIVPVGDDFAEVGYRECDLGLSTINVWESD